MEPANHDVPTLEEIKQQLEHMLSGKRFLGAPSQSRFLTLVVTLTLAGEEIKESIIAQALFPNFLSRESADVRVTARNLRDRLRRYYAQEGSQDRVIISLPEPQHRRGMRLRAGGAYLPAFAYNSRFGEQYGTLATEPSALEPFVSAARAARFVDINRRYLLVLARKGIAGAYALGTGTQRRIWVFRLSELAAAIARGADPQKTKTVRSSGSGSLR